MKASNFFFASLLFFACKSDDLQNDNNSLDGSVFTPKEDANKDAGHLPKDVATKDAENADAGFLDPDTIFEENRQIDGMRVHIHLQGTMNATTTAALVLGTGISIGHEYLDKPLNFLTKNRLLMLYDLRATGRSGPGPSSDVGNTFDAHVRDVERVLNEFNQIRSKKDPVDLIGHGYGALVFAAYAAQHPERIRKLILIAPYPSTAEEQALYIQERENRMSTSDRQFFQDQIAMNYKDCARDISGCSITVYRLVTKYAVCNQNRSQFDNLEFDYANGVTTLNVQEDIRDRRLDVRPQLEMILAPTLLVWGACDSFQYNSQNGKVGDDKTTLNTYLSHLTHVQSLELLETPVSGHFPMVEAPEIFQNKLNQFLGE